MTDGGREQTTLRQEQGKELPDREGTYDELRTEATKDLEEAEATEGEQDD